MMNPDEPSDRPSTPSENGQPDQDLAALFKRAMPIAPVVDVGSLLAALANRVDGRKNANASKDRFADRMDASGSVRQHPFSRRKKMIARLVAMILITIGIVGSFSLWNPIGPIPVMAQMQKAVEQTKSVIYTVRQTVDYNPATQSQVMLLGRNHIRAELSGLQRTVIIMDLAERKAVTLFPDGQTAIVMEGLTVPKNNNIFEFVTELNRHAPGDQRAVPKRHFEGLEVYGFVAEFGRTKFNVWVDKNTNLPIRVESESRETFPDGMGGQREQVTSEEWSNFIFDRALDKALFNSTPPKGYEVKKLGPNGMFAPYAVPKQNKSGVEQAQEKRPIEGAKVQLKDEENLQGVWQITSWQILGFEIKSPVMDQFKVIKWAFKEDQHIKEAGKVDGKPFPEQKFKFKLNPRENPKHIDLIPLINGEMKGEKTITGVYEIEGDDLKICLPQSDHPDRPKVLSSELDTDIFYVLKRKK
jgi:uncharacterized protein (TIGR03067 family)